MISICVFCSAGVPGHGAAIGETVLGQGDTAAAAVGGIEYTHVATFVITRATLLGAGVPLVSACVATLHPTIFIRTVAGDLIFNIGGV